MSDIVELEERIAICMANHFLINDKMLSNLSDSKRYLKLRWITKEQGPILVKDMERSHVQNTLNWCIRKGAAPDDKKDGILYSQWITYFTVRLLDPDLP